MTMKRLKSQRGAALLETAITIPLVLAVCVAIFEFGRAYQTWHVLTNAAREGARVAILADTTDGQVSTVVDNYLEAGRIKDFETATVNVERTVPFGSNTASRITVTYPYNFMFLNPVMRLLNKESTTGKGTTMMQSVALMRNES